MVAADWHCSGYYHCGHCDSYCSQEKKINAMTFDLIGNLGTLDYKEVDSEELIAAYERKKTVGEKQERCGIL